MAKTSPINTTAREIPSEDARHDVVHLDSWERGYSEKSFWRKLNHHAKHAGAGVIERALQLFYALQSAEMPWRHKMMAIGALGYFIVPLDLIPDFIPIGGYADDFATLSYVYMTIRSHITDDVRKRAHDKVRQWFPDAA